MSQVTRIGFVMLVKIVKIVKIVKTVYDFKKITKVFLAWETDPVILKFGPP